MSADFCKCTRCDYLGLTLPEVHWDHGYPIRVDQAGKDGITHQVTIYASGGTVGKYQYQRCFTIAGNPWVNGMGTFQAYNEPEGCTIGQRYALMRWPEHQIYSDDDLMLNPDDPGGDLIARKKAL